MKFKSVFLTLSTTLLAILIFLSMSVSVPAQRTRADLITAAPQESGRKKDADYWLDKAGLCATYGNNQAAIEYFQKVLALDPQRSEAYFGQGVSYGQLENYFKAIDLIDKAIALEPDKGMYYYGRGRVRLLAGEKEKALDDFRKAAALDDEDAQRYLDRLAKNGK